MVLCSACKRWLNWTRNGKVTCPAGHMGMYSSRLPPQPAGTKFDGRVADIVADVTAMYRFEDVDVAAGSPQTWETHNGVPQPPSAAK